ncbi:MAG: hypothetical protein ACRYG7_37505 [Janthinobacterium lividum]
MKFSHLLLAAGLCSFSAASAQTTPSSPRTANSPSSPNAVPSGTAPVASDPKDAVSPSEVFTKGAPNSNSTKSRKAKGSSSDGHGKMKTKM